MRAHKGIIVLITVALMGAAQGAETELKDPTRPVNFKVEENKKEPTVAPKDEAALEMQRKLSQVELKIQSILWSPKRKTAIVNNQIVKEGSSIAGYWVSEIKEKEVIFKSDGGERTEKLMFNSIKKPSKTEVTP